MIEELIGISLSIVLVLFRPRPLRKGGVFDSKTTKMVRPLRKAGVIDSFFYS